jgi:hypothetical protein
MLRIYPPVDIHHLFVIFSSENNFYIMNFCLSWKSKLGLKAERAYTFLVGTTIICQMQTIVSMVFNNCAIYFPEMQTFFYGQDFQGSFSIIVEPCMKISIYNVASFL